ncbi:hypothetical protein [Longimicrobium sp.]|uniref:hypothetical protein n=1 Tax=Longimicrobium sp. TaxID=2029185 RepID=UPI002E358797|nr:hypothetical protein [Longimicrobium sp.]HEX6040875.1 hypothetical protein [Longimicrobium sp.]
MSEQRKRHRAGPTVHRHPREHEGRDDESRPSFVPAIPIEMAHVAALELRDGPIPDARELVRYGYAHPDAPKMILDEFATQGAHRRLMERRSASLERMAMDAAVRSERLGVACALLIALVGFGCATYLVATGHGVEGTVIFGLDVCALVSAFILGRSRPPRGTSMGRAV